MPPPGSANVRTTKNSIPPITHSTLLITASESMLLSVRGAKSVSYEETNEDKKGHTGFGVEVDQKFPDPPSTSLVSEQKGAYDETHHTRQINFIGGPCCYVEHFISRFQDHKGADRMEVRRFQRLGPALLR